MGSRSDGGFRRGDPWILSLKAVLRDGENRFLLLRRSAANRHNVGLWELPGGKVHADETLGEALQREVREETGLEIELARTLGSATSRRGTQLVLYLILEVHAGAERGDELRLSEEHDAHRWVDPAELDELELAPPLRELLREAGGLLS